MRTKPKKRIAIVDAGRRPEIVEAVLPFIHDRYDLEFTTDYDADYVFHSCMGYDVIKHTGVRIFVTGENVSPNFNISDYALAFDQMDFGDRYCWLPLFKFYKEAYVALCAPRPSADAVLAQKTGFCAYVMSNTKDSAKERVDIFEALTKCKPVHSGGKWRNNVGGPVADKIAFQSKYKFVIAFENSSSPGYLTEKFAQAAQSNAIPIYWGDPEIANTFNSKAFINCHDYDSFEAIVDRVKQIDQDDALYRAMLTEPWFIDELEPKELQTKTIQNLLNNIFDQPHKEAYRRNRSRWGIKQERNLSRMCHNPLWHACHKLRDLIRGK
jgi:hypothetical protein